METNLENVQRLFAKIRIDDATDCWLYQGGTNGNGYGRVYWQGKLYSAHRLVYELCVNPIPPHLQVHHRCKVRHCVNVSHLQLVSHRVNIALTKDYEALRKDRLQDLLATHPELEVFGVTSAKSTTLADFWQCRSNSIPRLLTTMAFLSDGGFQWSVAEKGRGRRPTRFRLAMEQCYAEEVLSEDEPFQPTSDVLMPLYDMFKEAETAMTA